MREVIWLRAEVSQCLSASSRRVGRQWWMVIQATGVRGAGPHESQPGVEEQRRDAIAAGGYGPRGRKRA